MACSHGTVRAVWQSKEVMKKSSVLVALALAAAALGLGGCSTFETRANEKAEVFEALPVATQQRLERGRINVGDSEDLVYIALGQPDEKRRISRTDGNQSVWIYRTYWEQYEGTAWLGYRRIVVPTRRGYVVYHEPVSQAVYSAHASDTTRVAFTKGVVSAIDEQKL